LLAVEGVEDRHLLPRGRRMSGGCQDTEDGRYCESNEVLFEFPAVHGGLLLQGIELTAKVRLASEYRQTINGQETGDWRSSSGAIDATNDYAVASRIHISCLEPPRRHRDHFGYMFVTVAHHA